MCANVFEVLISVHATKSSRKVIFNLLCKGWGKKIKKHSLNMKHQTERGFCSFSALRWYITWIRGNSFIPKFFKIAWRALQNGSNEFSSTFSLRYLVSGIGGSVVKKNLPASARDTGSIPGSGRSPGIGKGNARQYSYLENSMEEPGRLRSMRSQRVTWLGTHTHKPQERFN